MVVKITRHDIGAEILSILTRGMYIDPRDALREYVQNGIDAGAKNIDIKVRGSSIVVQDNGEDTLPLEDAVVQLREAEEERSEADKKLKEILRGLGLEI